MSKDKKIDQFGLFLKKLRAKLIVLYNKKMERHFEDGNPDVRIPLSCLYRWRQNQFLSRVSSKLGPYDTQRDTSGARQDARVACMTFCSIGSNLPARPKPRRPGASTF